MPLFIAKAGGSPTALLKDGDRIVGYALTPVGARQLRAAGVRSGQKFPGRVLAALVRSGHAHSPRPADAEGQEMFGFLEEEKSLLPRCEMTGTTSDVHLVVYGDGSGAVAKLLGPEPRFVLQKSTSLSIPVAILSLSTLGQLETARKLPPKSTAAETLRAWLRQDFEDAWVKLAASNAVRQEALPMGGDEGELPLG